MKIHLIFFAVYLIMIVKLENIAAQDSFNDALDRDINTGATHIRSAADNVISGDNIRNRVQLNGKTYNDGELSGGEKSTAIAFIKMLCGSMVLLFLGKNLI